MATSVIEKSGTHTRSVKYCLKHTWVIDNFSLFYADPPNDTQSPSGYTYPEIFSASFSSSQDSRFQFTLLVKPKGESAATKDWIGVYLYVTLQEPAKPTMKFKVYFQYNVNYNSKYCLHG